MRSKHRQLRCWDLSDTVEDDRTGDCTTALGFVVSLWHIISLSFVLIGWHVIADHDSCDIMTVLIMTS